MRAYAVLVTAGDLVALLVGQKLRDGVGLLRIRDHPVADSFPIRVSVRPEHQLADAGWHFE